jgi:hypothetical protein
MLAGSVRSILSWVFTGVGAVLALAGVVTLFAGLKHLLEAAASRRWPSVPGRVVSSDVTDVSRKVQTGDEPEKLVHEHRVEVRYEYTLKGVLFSGIDLGEAPEQSTDERWAHERAAKFPKGAEVQVFYSPKDPTRSVLEPGIRAASWVGVLVALALMATGIAMVLISRLWLAPS